MKLTVVPTITSIGSMFEMEALGAYSANYPKEVSTHNDSNGFSCAFRFLKDGKYQFYPVEELRMG